MGILQTLGGQLSFFAYFATTELFMSEVGIRQGDVLSPSLFKIFINDLPGIIDDKTDSITLDGEKIPCLLYADDLVLFSDTKNGLQQKLNILNNSFIALNGV